MYSVVIPSMRSRRALLERCLASVGRELAGLEAEALVVVDDDQAVEGLAEAAGSGVDVRPIVLTGGAAVRRNGAFAQLRGDVIVLLDDDAEPLPGWGAALAAAFADGVDRMVQGAIWPDFETEPPTEVGPVIFSLGGFNRVDDRTRPGVFISANCAFTRAVLEATGPMREDLGPGSGGVSWGDDTEWHQRATRGGFATVFDEDLGARHRVDASRVTVDAVLARAERVGRTLARLEWDDSRPGAMARLRQALLAKWGDLKAGDDIAGRCLARRLAGYSDELRRIRAGAPPG